MKNNEIEQVYNALLNQKYPWRSIGGISKETKIPEEKVEEAIELLIEKNQVRKSFVEDISGKELFGLISRVDKELKNRYKS